MTSHPAKTLRSTGGHPNGPSTFCTRASQIKWDSATHPSLQLQHLPHVDAPRAGAQDLGGKPTAAKLTSSKALRLHRLHRLRGSRGLRLHGLHRLRHCKYSERRGEEREQILDERGQASSLSRGASEEPWCRHLPPSCCEGWRAIDPFCDLHLFPSCFADLPPPSPRPPINVVAAF